MQDGIGKTHHGQSSGFCLILSGGCSHIKCWVGRWAELKKHFEDSFCGSFLGFSAKLNGVTSFFLLLCCRDTDRGFQLYQSDPSGNYGGWKATAIGGNHQGAQNILKSDYKDDINLADAIKLVIKVSFLPELSVFLLTRILKADGCACMDAKQACPTVCSERRTWGFEGESDRVNST